ncbi:MAG: hypothetical protein RBQ71_06245 [Acholeplasmataceae bacterium]|nr:hypothetical protein [Acholeplasmataceae bacterium]
MNKWLYPVYFFLFGLVVRYSEGWLIGLIEETIDFRVLLNNINLVVFLIIPFVMMIFLVIPNIKRFDLLKFKVIYVVFNLLILSFISWFWITQSMWK